MTLRIWIASFVLIAAIVGAGAALAHWKVAAIKASAEESAKQPEPAETVIASTAVSREYRRTTTSIGTIIALRSITLRNEVAGTIKQVDLVPGRIVDAGKVLVQLDVSVEEAELKALEAQAALAETLLDRAQRLRQNQSATQEELDKARAERDVAKAQIARTKAVIDRKTIRAPFRARIGISDVHPGQYLGEGHTLTTLQGIDDAAHVDFAVNQHVAAGLKPGAPVEILSSAVSPAVEARVVAVDAKVDPATRNAMVRARIERAPETLAPGGSVRVRIPVGPPRPMVAVPANAVRKGATGDHVFVIETDKEGKKRARLRQVEGGSLVGDEVLFDSGLKPGEQIASSGSFKLREGALLSVAPTENASADNASNPSR
jgi:membrane fusion protein, multidrug efflux system